MIQEDIKIRDVFAINHHIMKILIEISRKIEERNRKIRRKTKDMEHKKQQQMVDINLAILINMLSINVLNISVKCTGCQIG